MKKADVLLLLVFVAVAGVLYGVIRFDVQKDGAEVVVTVDGSLYGSYNIMENQKIEIESAYGSNQVIIQDGVVLVADADCKDKLCKKHVPISKAGESIICLPHKTIISIEVEHCEQKDYDNQ